MSELTRRNFLSYTAQTYLGVTVGGTAASLFSSQAIAQNAEVKALGGGQATSVIYLYMAGGMSHVDTFDPKPQSSAEHRGATKAIDTNVDGLQLGHYLPLLSKHADKLALIRSMSSTQGAHGPGNYYTRTGYQARGTILHPTSGAWVSRLCQEADQEKKVASPTDLPSYVAISPNSQHPGAGFFDPAYSPLPIGEPSAGLQNSHHRNDVTEQEFEKQIALRMKLDHSFDAQYVKTSRRVKAYNTMYQSAVELMKSEDLTTFDLSQESDITHQLYGDSNFSKGCLLARRLVENKVRFVEVTLGGFDVHSDSHARMEEKMADVDQALSGLLHDLETKGLLKTTLVVLATEFGRSPKMNKNAGRDHFPKAYSCLMAGGGIKGGSLYGKTDDTGTSVTDKKVSPPDLNATIAHAMGLNHAKVLHSPSKRPFQMGGKEGKPITDLFA